MKFKKKMVLTFVAVGLSAFTYAQTGIGTVNPDNSAQLDITSNRRGLLIPRIALVKTTEQTPITAPAASLLVYNTANSNDVTPGFYYWDGKWVRIAKSEDFNIDNLTPEQITKIRGPQGVPGPQGDQGPTGPIGTFDTGALYSLTSGNSALTITGEGKLLSASATLDIKGGTAGQVLTSNGTNSAAWGTIDVPAQIESNAAAIIAGSSFNTELAKEIKAKQTVTSLFYNGADHSLIFTDENNDVKEFQMRDLVGDAQTLTTLNVNSNTGTLDYKDEDGVLHELNIGAAVKEPWFSSDTNMGATTNTEGLYTKGWVGIGYTTPSTAPNEKLRVNGAISTVNSYYADYVFEDYFQGFSDIKADYKFKDLETVDAFIKANKHLPGITPINELEKTKEGYSFNVSELSIQLLEKTEELYLHVIDQNKKLEEKEEEIKVLKEASKAMELRLEKVEKLLTNK